MLELKGQNSCQEIIKLANTYSQGGRYRVISYQYRLSVIFKR